MRLRLLVVLLAVSACSSAGGTPNAARSSQSATSITAAPTTTSTTTTTEPPTTTTTTTTTAVPPSRHVTEQAWIPFAFASDVTLHYPSSRVEHVGFHESNDEGAQQLTAVPGVDATTLEDRGRGTGSQTSADVVVDPDSEIRAPVSGTVVSSGSYVLYCDKRDYFLNIEPDDHPGWRVRMLHMTGLNVSVGDAVVGETVVAPHARQLPFASQVDDIRTADPAWPHIHMEIVDPSVPNVPNPGSGSENC